MRIVNWAVAALICATVACVGEHPRLLEPPAEGTPPGNPVVSAVSVNPTTATVLVGGTTQFQAVPKDQNGNSVASASIKWTSSDTTIAFVSDAGIVKARKRGRSNIKATAGAVAGSAEVVVADVPVASVVVSLTVASLMVGQSTLAIVELKDANGVVLTGRVVTWTSSNSSQATVSSAGMVTGVAPGTVSISAVSEGVSGSASLSIVPVPIASISIEPADVILSVGSSYQLAATAYDADGNALTGRAVSWSSSNSAVASVSAAGLVTALSAGSVTITASGEGKTGSASLQVTAVPSQSIASVLVSPDAATIDALGQAVQLSATAKDANGTVVSGASFAWRSVNTGVATVSTMGNVTAKAVGTALIIATAGLISDTATVTVRQVPASVTLNSASVALEVGKTTQLQATVRDAGGAAIPGTSATWTSSAPAVASVSSSGLVTAVAPGSATVTASASGLSASAAVTVTAPASVASVQVNPATATIAVGSSTTLSAVVKDAQGTVLTGRTVTWTSSNTAVATVNASGVVQALAEGSSTVTASSEGVSGTSAITVTAAPPLPPSGGILISSSELAALPMSGAAWDNMKAVADGSLGTPDISNQDNKHSVMTLAVALVAARTGSAVYREKARAAIMSAIGTERVGASNSILALGRILGAYVLAADLIGLDGADDVAFRAWLDPIRTRDLGGNSRWYSLKGTCEDSGNNWGAFACASLLAANLYLEDAAGVARSWDVFRGRTGDRTAFVFPDVSSTWRCEGAPWTPINVASNCGDKLGAPPEDAHRDGPYPTIHRLYVTEAMQGLAFTAELLHRAGHPAWERLRLTADFATRWTVWNASAVGTHLPWWFNKRLGMSVPTQPAGAGRLFGYTDWLYGY